MARAAAPDFPQRIDLRSVFLGHPKGVYVIASVEVWERFSFYGMRALLVLYLTAAVSNHGFGWSAGEALRFYGSYIALAYASPILGGFIADRYTGPRRALMIGSILMIIGHFLMTGPALVPWLIGVMNDAPVAALLYGQDAVPLGRLALTPQSVAGLRALASEAGDISVNAIQAAYLSTGYTFYLATGLIVLGTGFFKPSSYALLGRLYADTDARRENGVFLFQIAVNLGAVLAGIIAGGIGEVYGWHYGFSVAGLGMLVGALIFVLFQNSHLGSVPHTPPARLYVEPGEKIDLSKTERSRLVIIAIMGMFSALYWLAAEQYGGLINLYAQNSTDRVVLGFEIPATWFQSLNAFFIVTLTPFAMVLWSTKGRHLSPPQKFAIGFIMTAIGFALMVLAFEEAAAAIDQRSSALWLVGAYLFVTLGELCILSIGANMVNTYAPLRMIGLVLAFWFLCTALGNYGSGLVGTLTETIPDGTIFSGIAFACLIASAMLFTGARWWSRFMNDAEIRRQ